MVSEGWGSHYINIPKHIHIRPSRNKNSLRST
jgi:hypothetical protein